MDKTKTLVLSERNSNKKLSLHKQAQEAISGLFQRYITKQWPLDGGGVGW